MNNKLLELLKYEGPDIKGEFDKASVKGRGTSQEIADFRESYFQNFISRYFPFPHRVAKGNIVDTLGNESASIDCLLINPNHPYTIDVHKKFNVIFCDGVDFAIEVKPDVSTVSELHRGLKQVQSVKKLSRLRTPLMAISQSQAPDHIVEHSKRIPAFIFSIKAKADPMDTAKEILEYYRENSIPPEEQIDHLVINEQGIISNYKYPELSPHKNKETGLFWEEWGDMTIPVFLVYLNRVYHSAPTISSPILPNYIGEPAPCKFVKVEI